MARITHPRPQIGSQVDLGITFHDGIAERDLSDAPVLTQALEQHGFGIEDSDSAFCGLGPCSAAGGHEGTCAEASGWDELPADLDGTGENLPMYVEGDGEKTAPARRSKK